MPVLQCSGERVLGCGGRQVARRVTSILARIDFDQTKVLADFL
jgi:hypothetical protein